MRFLFAITTFTANQFESARICEPARVGPMDKETMQVQKPYLKGDAASIVKNRTL